MTEAIKIALISLASGVILTLLGALADILKNSMSKKEISLKDLKETLDSISSDMTNLKSNQLEMARDRIKHICRSRIKDGYITSDEYEDLTALHSSYKALGGNGYCDKLMERVEKLQIK